MEVLSHEIEIENNVPGYAKHLPLELAALIKKSIDTLAPISSECCIYKVTPKFRNKNAKFYTPQVISIGPLHHGKEGLKDKEVEKLRYLQTFLQRTNLNLEQLIDVVQKWEQKIRECYVDKIGLNSDDLVKMIVVDSCFVIGYILSYGDDRFEPNQFLPRLNLFCLTDLILLENQLPFFVVHGIYHLAFPHQSFNKFVELCAKQFKQLLLMHVKDAELVCMTRKHIIEGHEVKHLLDLLRLLHLPPTTTKDPSLESSHIQIPNATELVKSGVRLRKGSSHLLLDIKYTEGVLEIPPLVVAEYAEYILSNILALEMCLYRQKSFVREYLFFMKKLIDTPKDVDLLIRKGIIECLASDSSVVANLFNYIENHYPIYGDTYYLFDTSHKLNEYSKVTRHSWRAALKHDYCRTPWMIASTTAGIILLVLTLVQTICSFVSVV